ITHNQPHLHSFPTRRSSDLDIRGLLTAPLQIRPEGYCLLYDKTEGWVQRYGSTPSMKARAQVGSRRERRRTQRSQWIASTVETRSEEHTSELQSRGHLVCRL